MQSVKKYRSSFTGGKEQNKKDFKETFMQIYAQFLISPQSEFLMLTVLYVSMRFVKRMSNSLIARKMSKKTAFECDGDGTSHRL